VTVGTICTFTPGSLTDKPATEPQLTRRRTGVLLPQNCRLELNKSLQRCPHQLCGEPWNQACSRKANLNRTTPSAGCHRAFPTRRRPASRWSKDNLSDCRRGCRCAGAYGSSIPLRHGPGWQGGGLDVGSRSRVAIVRSRAPRRSCRSWVSPGSPVWSPSSSRPS